MKKFINFSWYFVVSQLIGLLIILAFCNFIFLLPSPVLIYGLSFLVGIGLFMIIKLKLGIESKILKILSILLFLISVGLIPILGKEL